MAVPCPAGDFWLSKFQEYPYRIGTAPVVRIDPHRDEDKSSIVMSMYELIFAERILQLDDTVFIEK
jgi:hypothetical protein